MSATLFDCPNCGAELSVDEENLGLRLKCPHCRKPFITELPKPVSNLPVAAARAVFRADQVTYESFKDRLFTNDDAFRSYRAKDIEQMYRDGHWLSLKATAYPQRVPTPAPMPAAPIQPVPANPVQAAPPAAQAPAAAAPAPHSHSVHPARAIAVFVFAAWAIAAMFSGELGSKTFGVMVGLVVFLVGTSFALSKDESEYLQQKAGIGCVALIYIILYIGITIGSIGGCIWLAVRVFKWVFG